MTLVDTAVLGLLIGAAPTLLRFWVAVWVRWKIKYIVGGWRIPRAGYDLYHLWRTLLAFPTFTFLSAKTLIMTTWATDNFLLFVLLHGLTDLFWAWIRGGQIDLHHLRGRVFLSKALMSRLDRLFTRVWRGRQKAIVFRSLDNRHLVHWGHRSVLA